MKRPMMQIYVKNSVEAVELYRKAFDATLVADHKNEDGTIYYHGELDIYGQILAVSEDVDNRPEGMRMQFCLHFDKSEKDIVTKAYEILKDGAIKIDHPLGPVNYSPHMASFMDRFGVYWCIFAA
ncbi:MAG: VOC family protein [Defluviitaleaceae bacterium]|nr:VOC family protein [Defluviitaleaceae bacterium]